MRSLYFLSCEAADFESDSETYMCIRLYVQSQSIRARQSPKDITQKSLIMVKSEEEKATDISFPRFENERSSVST